MTSSIWLPVLLASLAAGPERPLPVGAHNCYPVDRPDNPKLTEALALGVDNIELDLGWDAGRKQLIVGHDAAPRPGVVYPGLDATLVPALEAHWKAHPPGKGSAPTALTFDFKTDDPAAVRQFKEFLDAHADWFSTAPKAAESPLTERRLTVCLSGSDAAKDAYDALVPPGGTYRAFRDRVFGAGAKYQDDVAAYVPSPATAYQRFLAFHWSAVEKGGPALAGDWTGAEAVRLSALVRRAHERGYRVRIYCLNGHTGGPLSGYRFRDDAAAKARWEAAAKAGVDWVASDEYPEIVAALRSSAPARAGGPPEPTRTPTLRAVDLNVGESARVELPGGVRADVKLVGVEAEIDPVRAAVRSAKVTILLNEKRVTLGSGNYHLPLTVGAVQVDCPVTGDYRQNTTVDHWGLDKAARLRFWPAGAPWIDPETFAYPARQQWFAGMTQMANEPVYVDGGDAPAVRKVYYHSGLDIGGAEGLVEVAAATDGLVVSSGNDRLPGYDDSPVSPRYDVVYLLDDRGWYYRYSHMKEIDPAFRPGAKVKKGQRLGLLGKEGGSGGWSHLHFEVKSRQPSGKWGTQEGYAFLWQAAVREQNPEVIAVARPHRFARVGDTVVLDGSKSWCRSGPPARHDWTFSDGTTADKAVVERVYKTPGQYSEVLKVTDAGGHSAYDFAVVQVIDPARPGELPPTINAAYYPTSGVKAGAPLTFKARTFRVGRDGGEEAWDFGDGTPTVTTRSDGNAEQHAPDGYAVTPHAFARPGDYLVRVSRADRRGFTATARLHVHVD